MNRDSGRQEAGSPPEDTGDSPLATRRVVLGTLGTGLTAGLAGCGTLGGTDEQGQSEERPDGEGKTKSCDLSETNELSGCDFSGRDLSDADLSGANLSNANLSEADLRNTDLQGSDLSGATWVDGSTCSTADCDGRVD